VAFSRRALRPAQISRQSCRQSARSLKQQLRAQAEEAVLAEEAEEAPVASEAEEEAPAAAEAQSGAFPDEKPAELDAEYALNVLWLDKSIGLSVDQVFKGGQKSPITEYFFWPKTDAWEALNVSIEAKDWISERNRVLLLNLTTDVINFWQDEATKHSIDEAREKYPQVQFQGN
jgi:30S ribosomal protein 3